MKEDEIQERVQQGEEISGPDGAAYRKVFQALGREPEFRLSPSFSDRVVRRALVAPGRSNDIFWLYTGLAACFIALVAAVWTTGFEINLPVPGLVKDNPGFIAFGLLFVLSLQWLDRKVVRKIS